VFHMADDQELEDRITRLLVDSSVLEAEPPLAGIGTGALGSGFFYPGQLYPFKADSSVTAIGTGRNIGNLFNLLNNIEQQIDRDSLSKTEEGQITPGDKTKYEIQRTETNSAVQRGIFGRMIGDLVKDFGDLMIDINIQHTTVGEAESLLSGEARLKFKTILLPNQTEAGKKITRKIKFKQEMIGRSIGKKDRERESFRIMGEQGGKDADTKLYEVNPQTFRMLKFQMYVDYETLLPNSKEHDERVAIRNYQLMRSDPLFDPKEVARDLAEVLKKGDSEKYMSKEEIPPETVMGMKSASPKEAALI